MARGRIQASERIDKQFTDHQQQLREALDAARAARGGDGETDATERMLQIARGMADFEQEIPTRLATATRRPQARIVWAFGTAAVANLLAVIGLALFGPLYWGWVIAALALGWLVVLSLAIASDAKGTQVLRPWPAAIGFVGTMAVIDLMAAGVLSWLYTFLGLLLGGLAAYGCLPETDEGAR